MKYKIGLDTITAVYGDGPEYEEPCPDCHGEGTTPCDCSVDYLGGHCGDCQNTGQFSCETCGGHGSLDGPTARRLRAERRSS